MGGAVCHGLDAALGVMTQTTMAIPSFFLGILVTYVFGILLGAFAPGGYVSYRDNFAGFLGYLVFPAMSISLPKIAMTARFLRNSMLTELSSDYVRTAYSKGASKRRVMYGHVLRNAMMPVATFLGMIVAEIGGQYSGGAGIRIAGNWKAAGQLYFHQGFSCGGDPDLVYYLCGNLCVLSGGYSVQSNRSENQRSLRGLYKI